MSAHAMPLDHMLCNTKEQFPRIYESIEMLWGYPELQDYLSKLIVNGRATTRSGFPHEVAKELVSIHTSIHTHDIWALNYC